MSTTGYSKSENFIVVKISKHAHTSGFRELSLLCFLLVLHYLILFLDLMSHLTLKDKTLELLFLTFFKRIARYSDYFCEQNTEVRSKEKFS